MLPTKLHWSLETWRWLAFCGCLLYNIHQVLLMDCHRHLGGRHKVDCFFCSPPDRATADIVWMKDGVLITDEDKYEVSPTKITIPDIVYGDEGNYSCMYMTTASQYSTYWTGCLLVYGSAFLNADEEHIEVNDDGTIFFNLSLTFSMAGSSGLMQEMVAFILVSSTDPMNLITVVSCSANLNAVPCTFSGAHDSQWWTVDTEEGEYHVVFVLHQARSSDRGSYRVLVEGRDPATGNLDAIRKTIYVAALECAEPFPNITGGSAMYLESTKSDIVGSQVNYSCNSSCALQGSSSLRCKVVVMNGQPTSEWIDEMGNASIPSCTCDGTSISSEHIHVLPASSSTISKTKDSMMFSLNLMESPTGVNVTIDDDDEQAGQNETLGIAIGIPIGIFILVAVILLVSIPLYLALMKRNRSNVIEYGDKQESLDAGCKEEVAMSQYMSKDDSRSVNDSSVSSIDDNNRFSFIETFGNESFSEHPKNSYATYV